MAQSASFAAPFFRPAMSALVLLGSLAASSAQADDAIFDEMRFGLTAPVEGGKHHERGLFPSFTVFFDPLGADSASTLAEKILRPRIHAGASAATSSSGINQMYGGFSWDADIGERLFVELGAGATVHDGNLDDGSDGPKLGCRVLFREYAAAGYRFDANWSLSATIEHNSHANICDGPNGGLTRAGLMLGYRF